MESRKTFVFSMTTEMNMSTPHQKVQPIKPTAFFATGAGAAAAFLAFMVLSKEATKQIFENKQLLVR